MRLGKVHHAWIFHGPDGVGKKRVAYRAAQALLCHQALNQSEPCGTCDSCRLLAQPNAVHPDFHIIYKELAADSEFAKLRSRKQMNIPIDLLRETMVGGFVDNKYIEPVVARKPMLNHGKAFIVDDAELLDAVGQNALLKLLEEPPPDTYIFLVTSHEDELLPTIRSRCQRVAFGPLTDPQVSDWVANRSGSPADPWLVRFARGSLGRAVLALEYNLGQWAQTLESNASQLVAGKPDTQFGATMAGLVDAFAESWVKNNKGASKEAANKAGVRHMLGLIGEVCRRNLRTSATPQAAAPWLTGIDLLQEAEWNLDSNVALALLLDNMAIQWSAMNSPHPVG